MAKYVRAQEVAELLAVPVNDVAVLVARGMPEAGRDKYDPNDVVPWYIGNIRRTIFENAKKIGITLR